MSATMPRTGEVRRFRGVAYRFDGLDFVIVPLLPLLPGVPQLPNKVRPVREGDSIVYRISGGFSPYWSLGVCEHCAQVSPQSVPEASSFARVLHNWLVTAKEQVHQELHAARRVARSLKKQREAMDLSKWVDTTRRKKLRRKRP